MGLSISRAALFEFYLQSLSACSGKIQELLPETDYRLNGWCEKCPGCCSGDGECGNYRRRCDETGLGLKLGNSIVGMAANITSNPTGLLFLTLIFTMITSIIIGMGSPTTANYIITSTIALPAILALNGQLETAVPVLAAHMFVFYWNCRGYYTTGCIGRICSNRYFPRRADPDRGNASKLAIAAFIIPYMFVFQPQLLMIDTNIFEII